MDEPRAHSDFQKIETAGGCHAITCPPPPNGTANLNGNRQRPLRALHVLLMERADLLHRYVRNKIPAKLQHLVTPDDVLQDVWFAAFRAYADFKNCGPDSFDRWLMRITERRMLNVFRSVRRMKRGGNANRERERGAGATSYFDLCAHLTGNERTPSSEDAAREAVHAVQIALGELPERYRTAIVMHHIEGRPRRDVARAMGTTPPAVNSLLFRGLCRLRTRLGSASRYFSDVPQSRE
jgi:RNA polymerase sigma-70 factor (ECF subfamily)